MNDRTWKLYIVDNNYIQERIKQLFAVDGKIGTIVKFRMFSVLREEEMVYVYDISVCPNLSDCNCSKLHVIKKPNGSQ